MVLLAALPAQAQLEDVAPGIQRLYHRNSEHQVNMAFIDLCHPGVSVRTTRHGERGRTVPSFGAAVGAAVAVNGDFFGGSYSTDGLAMSDGALWPGSHDHSYVGPIAFGANTVEMIEHWAERGPEPWMREIVSGHPTIVWSGNPVDHAIDPMSTDPLCTRRNPRTGVGLSADRRTLILAVVDGRRSSMIGMTCRELANLMIFWGAEWAMNMDGGGSSTMWMNGRGVLNSPSDGSPRVVGNHLAVRATGTGAAPHCHRRFGAEWIGAGGWPGGTTMTLEAGSEVEGWFELRNTGTDPWDGGTRLAIARPRDGSSPIAGSGWLADHRPTAVDGETAPGEIGRFTFRVRAPDTPGTYRQHFELVQELVSWFSDSLGPPDDAMWLEVHSVPAAPPEPDAGAPAPDAGVPIDAGYEAGDGGAPPAPADGGDGDSVTPPPGEEPPDTLMGTCSVGGGPPSSAGLLLLALLALTTRRRRRSARRAPR